MDWYKNSDGIWMSTPIYEWREWNGANSPIPRVVVDDPPITWYDIFLAEVFVWRTFWSALCASVRQMSDWVSRAIYSSPDIEEAPELTPLLSDVGNPFVSM